jgi:hypothetical protein
VALPRETLGARACGLNRGRCESMWRARTDCAWAFRRGGGAAARNSLISVADARPMIGRTAIDERRDVDLLKMPRLGGGHEPHEDL